MTALPAEPGFAVVAVDGSEEGYAAVARAAQEARRQGLSLRLAHVMPASLSVGPLLTSAPENALGAYASETLASARRVVADVAPEVEVSTHVLTGGRVAEIVGLAEHARFVVVGRRPSSSLDRAWAGGTLDGIVSRARCPVLVVPRVSRENGGPLRVVLGFKSTDHSAELLDAAFRTADEIGAELEVVHAWKLSVGYDDIIARRVSEPTWNRDRKSAIWDLLEPWQESYPDVRTRIRVVHDYPVRALVEASRDADLVVVGKPLHGSLVHHLGRTARGVLRFAQCAVEVVPAKPREALTMPPLTVEESGELVP
jgi:nucleotide-binding universal stress UspA family protein